MPTLDLPGLLRYVDGWPHLLLGPVLLAFAGPLAEATGVGVRPLIAFLVAFTAYGVVVLVGLRDPSVPRWLATEALAANVAFLVVVSISMLLSDLTTLGWWVHGLALLSGAGTTVMLLRESRRYFAAA